MEKRTYSSRNRGGAFVALSMQGLTVVLGCDGTNRIKLLWERVWFKVLLYEANLKNILACC